ncbi:MAG: hypothetical protein EBU67_08890 [Actinobacteria bacterium]|nr:hypothetical protein [Actinomycetota bacterium]
MLSVNSGRVPARPTLVDIVGEDTNQGQLRLAARSWRCGTDLGPNEPPRTFQNLAGRVTGRLVLDGEFDPGSGRTLAACLTHASRTESMA